MIRDCGHRLAAVAPPHPLERFARQYAQQVGGGRVTSQLGKGARASQRRSRGYLGSGYEVEDSQRLVGSAAYERHLSREVEGACTMLAESLLELRGSKPRCGASDVGSLELGVTANEAHVPNPIRLFDGRRVFRHQQRDVCELGERFVRALIDDQELGQSQACGAQRRIATPPSGDRRE